MINKNDIRIGHSGFSLRVRQFGSEVADPMVIVDLVDHTGSILERATVRTKITDDDTPALDVVFAGQSSVEPDTGNDTVPAEEPEPEPEPENPTPEPEEPEPEEPEPVEEPEG